MDEELRDFLKRQARITAEYTLLGERTPKDKQRYVFIGRRRGGFSGNTKYQFLHMLRHHPELDCRYFTEERGVYNELCDAGLPAAYFPSRHAVEVLAGAGTVVVESISFRTQIYYPLLAGARQIQLWHGVGNKKIGFLLRGVPVLQGYEDDLLRDHSDYDLIVSTSPFYTEEVFRKSMHAKEFASLGYPRTDVLYRPVDKQTLVGCDLQAYSRVRRAAKRGPVVLFAPTFRDTDMNPITQNVLDLRRLVELFAEHDAHLLVKPHGRIPLETGTLPDNVTFCRSDSDVYPFFPLVDAMITDYSSIHTEFLLMNRPVLFFWADFDSYMAVDRGFQFPFESMCPGPKCRDAESLIRELENVLTGGPDHWAEARSALRDKAFSHQDGRSAQRVAEHILQGEFAPAVSGQTVS
ncbi:CDP-Glycerol:Poly(glycerophosphate) glycerophosphotransferase [Paucidesulfovibrio gracilis DSM 16080]|uniref:CDP-Glycerol:Poly(Glycerophosphate) glycerophosphotransferase n=1 Tax=Paucidesulfovibrio gracilis DSM 16080 TaxID=1121449 RepID=A0A1T4XPN8_9BACT|nr:CDP-glycerol glycerophosphotransferase family protein [Paucidesulfovibrio gracilis]SKA91539.1 CDP-Glycerol:Poly(glycerophosphate) glycerophosphotransferase [Paucidesulfovibrio gracilis DSM 16080]